MDDDKFRDLLQKLGSLPPDVLHELISLPPEQQERILSHLDLEPQRSILSHLFSGMLAGLLLTFAEPQRSILSHLFSEPQRSIASHLFSGLQVALSLTFTGLQVAHPYTLGEKEKEIMVLLEELAHERSRSAQLEQEIREQEIKLNQEKFKSTQLEQKITEQDIKLKESRRLPRYEMSSCPRGICVIINNINFSDGQKRIGAEFDEKALADLYTELQFEVHRFRDLQWDEMRKVAVDFAKKDHRQFDAFVFIVMSHGGDKDVIYGVSGRHIRVEDLMSEFKATNCPTLRNKPKLFIIQTCRGSSDESLSPISCDSDTAAVCSPDSTLARSVCPQEADFLLSFATAPGYKAWRYPGSGSPYIQFLVEEIRKYHHNHHLLDILTEVIRRVVEEGIQDGKAIQCPAPTHTLQGQVFL